MRYVTVLVAAITLLFSQLSCVQGTPQEPTAIDVFRIEGNLMVPAGDITLIAINPLDFLLGGTAQAAATGLVKAGEGVEVRLVRINDEGKQSAKTPLATTLTDKDGHYVLTVPASQLSLPALDVVIEAGNAETGAFLRNFATSENLDLSPLTTAMVQLIVDRNEPLFTVPLEVLAEVQNLVNESTQTIDFTNVSLSTAVNNTLSSLKSSTSVKTKLDTLLGSIISGTVLAPNGQVAYLPPNMIERINHLLIPPAVALTGLQSAGSDVTVNLNQIDNNGNFVGQPLKITKTRADGRFSFEIPENVTISSDFVVSVGSGPSLMRAFLIGSANLNVSPLTEMAVRAVLNNSKLLNQPQIPLSQFSPAELINLLDAVQRSTANTNISGISGIGGVLPLLEPVITSNSTVLSTLKTIAGIPAPVVNPVLPATAQDSVTISGTARDNTTVKVEGGISVVQKSLGAGETQFSITVPLKRNTKHSLLVTAAAGGEVSLPAVVTVRHDSLNPVVDTSKITATNPGTESFQTTIQGSTGAIRDNGRSTVIIADLKLGNRVTVQTDSSGSFTATLAADAGDTLSIVAIDESGNQGNATVVVGVPGPGVTTLTPSFAAEGQKLTMKGAGYSPTLANNTVIFTSPFTSLSTKPNQVEPDGTSLEVEVPPGLLNKLSDAPATVTLKVSVNGIDSNNNRQFTLLPAVNSFTQSQLKGNGEAEFFLHDNSRQTLLMTTQSGISSGIINLDLSGNLLSSDIARNLDHESIFRDIALDSNSNLLVSNFSVSVLGATTANSANRPLYRLSKYEVTSDGSSQILVQRLSESGNLGEEPGALALSPADTGNTNARIYVALPKKGNVLKVDYVNNQFGKQETLLTGLPTPIKDMILDNSTPTRKVLYITAGTDTRLFKITLNGEGNADIIDSNFVTGMGTGNGRLAIDGESNLFLTIGIGIDRVTNKGVRINLVPSLDGDRPTVGLVLAGNSLYINQLSTSSLFKVSP